MNKFFLPKIDLDGFAPVGINGRSRYATATDVEIVDSNTILVMSLYGKSIYKIDVSNNSSKILEEFKTPFYGDTMNRKDNLLLAICFPTREFSYGVISTLTLNNSINIEKTCKLDGYLSHGGAIIDKENVIFTNTYNKKRGIYFYNMSKERIYKKFDDFLYYPKDVWIYNNKLIIITSDFGPGYKHIKNNCTSCIYLYDLSNLKMIDMKKFNGITDAISFNGKDGFITIQSEDSIIHFSIVNDKIRLGKITKGFNFPHGISVNFDKVAVTNYGDNSIQIYNLNELL